ncbi:uncharacterized protein EDB91DRAFT_1254343 [Suillus paluster]|uniref:uncharacterized protein n=1 Tax=Suillus paluster TaxID=48578 RepID=UPI001B885C8D|nr:uncharacterized protein EDB91DRAFT_1254343 [Suillus paluster]KAG1726440.1 hypothetical protein EDB91DRAFT_1254343 [Suillus paluster]
MEWMGKQGVGPAVGMLIGGTGGTRIWYMTATKKCQTFIEDLVGQPTEKVTARSGNVFYINNIANAIANDYANPLTRFAMQDYPEDGGNGMLQESSGAYFIPEWFFLGSPPVEDSAEHHEQPNGKILYALGHTAQRTDAGFIINDEREIVPTAIFAQSYEDISSERDELECGLTASSEKAQGRMVYMVPLIIFMDDVSRNILKQWNNHHAIYMLNANLPREMLEKEFFVRFVTSSPHAAPMELINTAQSGIVAWDCKDEEEVMLIPSGLFLAGDNPMQAEECSHAGLSCNYFCRMCDVGGTKEHKASEEGYNSIFKTTNDIRYQFEAAMKSGATTKVQNAVSSTGVRDSASASILESLVELGKKLCINIHLDTPTEILHTVLLGVVKYFWGQTVFLLEKAKLLHVFQSCLEFVDKDGMNAPSLNADYICHYKGSLIGKHFKSLAQVMPFLVHDLVPWTVLNAWSVIGELVALVWHTTIPDTEEYLARLSQTIEDFLNVTAQCAPSILISKPKFHFLVHLLAFICRFGPAIIFSTKRYESFNHIFRLSYIVKHITMGRHWYDSKTKKWAHLLGISSILHEPPLPGTGSPETAIGANGKAQQTDGVEWKDTHCAEILGTQSGPSYCLGKSLVTSKVDRQMSIRRISEILISHSTNKTVDHVVLQVFSFGPALHQSLFLQCLDLTDNELVSTVADIICTINLQHNCIDSKCIDMRQQHVHQERIKTARTKPVVDHQPTPYYFLNAYSIHNCDLIRLVIPKALCESPLRVVNPAEVRTLAVQQMKDKKAAKKGGEIP